VAQLDVIWYISAAKWEGNRSSSLYGSYIEFNSRELWSI